MERRYIEKQQKQLVPTELGRIVNKLLVENFKDIVNVEFTADIESQFDNIAEGKEEWKQMIRDFYGPFKGELDEAEKNLEHVEIKDEVSDVKCDKCGRMMVYKYGRFGKFLACPGYPECKNTKAIVETINVPCPKCGVEVQVRKTKRFVKTILKLAILFLGINQNQEKSGNQKKIKKNQLKRRKQLKEKQKVIKKSKY